FDRASRVDADEDSLVGIEGDQRRRLGAVHLKPMPDHVFLVVIPLEELPAAVVADAGLGGRLVQHVPYALAPPAGAPTGQPPDHLVLVDDELTDNGQLL